MRYMNTDKRYPGGKKTSGSFHNSDRFFADSSDLMPGASKSMLGKSGGNMSHQGTRLPESGTTLSAPKANVLTGPQPQQMSGKDNPAKGYKEGKLSVKKAMSIQNFDINSF